MGRAKFSVNALLLIVAIFSGILFFFTVSLFDMTNSIIVMDDYYPIEGSEYAIRYSTIEESGVYKGPKNTGELISAGRFAGDWGFVMDGDKLYLTEYIMTDLNLILCKVVMVELTTGDEWYILENSIIRGKCKSGELVCITDVMIPAIYPETNVLCKFYSMASPTLRPENKGGTVTFLDPETLDEVYSVWDENVFGKKFESIYLNRTLDEIAR